MTSTVEQYTMNCYKTTVLIWADKLLQAFTSEHDGLDLVGQDSKQIQYSKRNCIHAGWENSADHSKVSACMFVFE